MLKKSVFSPAQPRRAATRLFPYGVLSCPSPCNVPPVIELPWQLGVGGWKRNTARLSNSLRPCWTAFLSILRLFWHQHHS